MFRRNCWYVAGWCNEVTSGGVLSRTILGKKIVFWRGNDRKLIALADSCSRRHATLSLGVNEGDGLWCPYHGLKFWGRSRSSLPSRGWAKPFMTPGRPFSLL